MRATGVILVIPIYLTLDTTTSSHVFLAIIKISSLSYLSSPNQNMRATGAILVIPHHMYALLYAKQEILAHPIFRLKKKGKIGFLYYTKKINCRMKM